jgi:hypothetical protein
MVAMRKLPKNVRISFRADALTHFGGLYLLQAMVRRWQMPRLIYHSVRFRRWNATYTTSEEVMAILYPSMLGLGRMETTRLLQQNGAFQYLTGLQRYPDPSTLRRFLSRFGRRSLEAFGRLHDRCRTRLLNTSTVIFDLDTTVLTVYGQQQHAAVGFNPSKRGRPSFQPLLCFEGGSGVCWEAQFLPGNTHPLSVAIPLLRRAWAKLPAGKRRVRVRADPAFGGEKFLAFLEEKRAVYAVAVRMTLGLKHRLEGLHYHRYGSGLEAAALKVRLVGWSVARRVVIVRRPVPEEPTRQLHLFQLHGYSYEAIATNAPWLALNVWKFYNGRATAELVIRELKSGCAVGHIPRHDWAANEAYFHLVLFAYNLLVWFKELYLPREWKRINIQTLRNRLLWVPALLVRPQGRPTLRLPRSYPYQQQFLQTLHRIERRPVGIP